MKKELLDNAVVLSNRNEHGHMIRFKDGCYLTIFSYQIILWNSSGLVMAYVDLFLNEVVGEHITLKDFSTYIDEALTE